MNIDPGWEKHIVCYLHRFQWFTPESIAFERAKNRKAFVNANPYTWKMILNRRDAGQDVPSWLIVHADEAIKLREAG